jgi:hypothetical protein
LGVFAARTPLLFALDGKLDVPDGFRYVADSRQVRRQGMDGGTAVHCGGDGCGGVDQ